MIEQALAYSRLRQADNLERLRAWLRIPSVSTLPEYKKDVLKAARWAADFLSEIGFPAVQIVETPGHPLVFAEMGGLTAPTLLVYGHYDVQPVDPLEDWVRPPFDPQVEGEDLYARGASDDKGQALAIFAALEAYLKTSGRLPVNIKVLLEGEEEISSPNLYPYLRQHASQLAADAILIADQDMLGMRVPVILYGVRGNMYAEIEVTGPSRDLHSGTFGGAIDNPLNVLVRMLAALQDGQTRRVLIPDFYDQVDELAEEERRLIAAAPISDEAGLYLTGAPILGGEQGYSLAERISVRPTFEVHGIAGGFTGQGQKTVIPARATAKISTRLVPHQDPYVIAGLLETFLKQIAPATVSVKIRVTGASYPVKIDYHAPAVQAAIPAYEKGFGFQPVLLRGGGSLPIVPAMVDTLSQPGKGEIPVVLIGFGLPDDRTHAPNEKFHLPNFYKGIETVIHYLIEFAEMQALPTINTPPPSD